MPQVISNIKDDLKFVYLLSCFVGHPVVKRMSLSGVMYEGIFKMVVTYKKESLNFCI